MATIEQDVALVTPDAHVIAQNMVNAKGKNGKVRKEELAQSITQIQVTESIKQLNTLTVTLHDPGWNFMDSGFFDTDHNSQMDPIDVNYPQGSGFWWRLTQITPTGGDHSLAMVFVPRGAETLMHFLGPVKAARAQMTRAQFLKMLADKAGVKFSSSELTQRQPIAAPLGTATRFGAQRRPGRVGLLPTSSASGGKPTAPTQTKPSGIQVGQGYTAKGSPINSTQAHAANVILGVGAQLRAPQLALVAMVYAAIWESDLGVAVAWNSLGYGGVLAGNDGRAGWGGFGKYGAPGSDAVSVAEATAFLKGTANSGYQNGGAINLSRVDHDPVSIATRVEQGGSYSGESGYPGDAAAIAEATKLVNGFNGNPTPGTPTGPASHVTLQPYYFEVMPKETYWAAMVRLAQEVNWELWWGSETLFYDSEQAIVANYGVAAIIDREDPAVTGWNYTWDVRQKCTTFSLTLIDKMFGTGQETPGPGLFAGQVFQLKRFGPASSGSSAYPKKFPGHWIVQDRTRVKGDITSTYTLVQPDLPKQEPAPQVSTSGAPTTAAAGATGAYKGTPNSRGVINPIPGFTNVSLDFGVDADAKAGSPIYAPADCSIVANIQDFYKGQHLVLYKFDLALPQAPSQYWYLSEQVSFVSMSAPRHFKRGDVVGRFASSGTGIEIGWGVLDSGASYRLGEARLGAGTDHSGPAGNTSANVYGKSFAEYFGIPLPGFTG